MYFLVFILFYLVSGYLCDHCTRLSRSQILQFVDEDSRVSMGTQVDASDEPGSTAFRF